MNRSFFITVDGIDGVGKSTQIARLRDHLVAGGQDVLTVRDPGTTPVGTELRKLLLDSTLTMHRRSEAMLFMASRCELVETVIRPALAEGRIVISDRYLLSTVVYQSIGGEVTAESLWELGRLVNAGVDPDLTVLMDMPAVAARERIAGPGDRMESRGVEYMESVRQAFLCQLPNSSAETGVVDAQLPVEAVADEIRQLVDQFLSSRG